MRSPVIAMIMTFTLGWSANAVMRPDLAFQKTGLPNHLLPKDLGQQLRAVKASLNEFTFPTIPAEVTTYPYAEESMTVGEAGAAQLSAIFNAVFREASAEKFLLYRNIFYGYESERVVYDVAPGSRGEGNNQVFWIEHPGEAHFKIHLHKDLGPSLIFDSLARLVALMTADMQADLISHLGGIGIYREIHLKVKWVSEIYSGFLLWDLAQRLPEELVRDQLVDLASRADRRLVWQLTDLEPDDADTDNLKLWYTRWIQPQSAIEYDYIDDILNLSLDLLEGHFLAANLADWREIDHDQLAGRMFSTIKDWWRGIPGGRRFRTSHEAYVRRDSLLESVIATESIVIRKCDALLTSHH